MIVGTKMFDENRLTKLFFVVVVLGLLFGAMGFYYILSTQQSVSYERSEWAYDMIEAKGLNEEGYYGEGVIVAIIDTGLDLSHPEMSRFREGEGVLIWKDLVGDEAEPYDDNGHGTAMAGLIAGKTYGVAPMVDLIVIKTITSAGSGKVDDIAYAIRFAVGQGADLISLSLGGGRFPILGTDAERACEDALAQGVFVVAAAGNDGENDNGDVDSPSNVELVISAGAVDSSGSIASFSSMGDNDGRTPFEFDDRVDPNKKPEIVAPGVDINVPLNGGKYGITSGTSVSTAFVSGIIALTLDAHEGYQHENNLHETTIEKYKNVILETAQAAPGQSSHSHDDRYGYGIIQGSELNDRL
jgi:serine protease AprX